MLTLVQEDARFIDDENNQNGAEKVRR